MESFSNMDEPFPSPPSYFLPGNKTEDMRVYQIVSPCSRPPLPTSFSFSPGNGCSTQTHSPPSAVVSLQDTDTLPSQQNTENTLCCCSVLNPRTLTPVSPTSPSAPVPKVVSFETDLHRTPALTTCSSCQSQVTTQVTFRVGTYAWLMCLVFLLCGLVLGCCLIPFFINHFKDAHHTCPRCGRVLHVHRKTCCQ